MRSCLIAGLALVLSFCSWGNLGQGAEPLRYKLEPQQKFGYEVTVQIDHGSKIDIYQGPAIYTVKSVSGETITLSYQGGLSASAKAKNGSGTAKPESFSADAYRGLKPRTSSEIVMSSRGQIVGLNEETQLPYMLGNLSLLAFEAVPDVETQGWTLEGSAAVREKAEQRQQYDPITGRPIGGFRIPTGPPSRPRFAGEPDNGSSGKTTAAATKESFLLKGETNGVMNYAKTYSMKIPEADGSITIEGDGTWKFSRKIGKSESLEFNERIVMTKGNVTMTFPISVSYRLLTTAELDQVQAGWAESDRQFKERSDQMFAEMRRKDEEKKKLAATPLTPQETSQALAVLQGNSSHDDLLNTLTMLAKRSPANPDPAIVQGIQRHLKHSDSKVKGAAESALAQWDGSFKTKMELDKQYRGPGSLRSTSNLSIDGKTPLVPGQIVAVKWGGSWFASEIVEALPDGKVVIHYRGWGSERETVTRDRIHLAPPALEQPASVAAALKAAGGGKVTRTWTDASGRFKIEAVMLKFADGKVSLKRTDGREIDLPLEKLSAADQAYVKQEAAEPKNPFE